jgi:ABC-2 type transport system ATP-binding protein
MSEAFVQIDNLKKTYRGSSHPAVNGLNLLLREGEIHGILGPNGAGKTTSIGMLMGLIKADSGFIHVAGLSIPDQIQKLKKLMGLVPQDIALYQALTAYENLNYFAAQFNIPRSIRKELINKYLQRVGLYERRNDKVKTFSGGMKRRVNLIAGLLHQPRLLILDEPTVGTDVQSKNMILELLEELNQNGMTILYTSHLMEEAERICHNVCIIDRGRNIEQGNPKELIQRYPNCKNLEEVFVELTGYQIRD